MVTSPTSTRPAPGWDRIRLVVAVGWVLLAVTVVIVGERTVSVSQLESDLASGRVNTVQVTGGLPAGGEGFSTQQVRYDDGWFAHRVEIRLVSPGVDDPGGRLGGGDQRETVRTNDIGADIERRHPGVRVVREEWPESSATIASWTVPGWVGVSAIALSLAVLYILVAGPRPWRATRWAWFWLLSTPVGAVAFLILSGPTPPVPVPLPRDGSRRLTGGWALLLSLLVGSGWASLQ